MSKDKAAWRLIGDEAMGWTLDFLFWLAAG
jgi:hypothetical protein